MQNPGRNPRKTNGLNSVQSLPAVTQSFRKETYTGRFAPSPTGPLHLGSLFTALASYLDARAYNGKWLLRIDDLDTPRNQPGATDAVLKCLDVFGLHWDGEVYYQSRHLADYEKYLAKLDQQQLTYRCECSRKFLAELEANSNTPGSAAVYPGICRNKQIKADTPSAVRIKTDNAFVSFEDSLQGLIASDLAAQHGDFILKRKDGIIAYQFAVVVDDYLQNINHVVRGYDLLLETPKQIYLQQLLGLQTPAYAHVPIIVDQHGYKLSKQTLATAIDSDNPGITLFKILSLLKLNPSDDLSRASVNELLAWGVQHWRRYKLVKLQQIPCI